MSPVVEEATTEYTWPPLKPHGWRSTALRLLKGWLSR